MSAEQNDGLKANTLDDRRRLTMPDTFPAGAAVIVHQLDDETVVVSRCRRDRRIVFVDLQGTASKGPPG